MADPFRTDGRLDDPVRAVVSRRTFLAMSGAGVLGLYVSSAAGVERVAAAPGTDSTLTPDVIPKFVRPLVIPPPMPSTATDAYRIAARQFEQEVLPPPHPRTTVWGYGAVSDASTFNFPAFTIEATRGAPLTVTWINDLTDADGHFLPHLLPVDPTLHWANPPGGILGRDSRPLFASTPEPYSGPVPLVTHVHGMEDVADWSDGYAEAWFLPDAADIPAGHATVGTWFDFFKAKAGTLGGEWVPGQVTFRYPNSQRPSTAWYHDHTLGMTRLNV